MLYRFMAPMILRRKNPLINRTMENDEIDDETTTKIVDHIMIRDPSSGEVLVNKRGERFSRLVNDNFDGNSRENSPDGSDFY